MTDTDGVEESFEGQLRLVVTTAARLAEQMERAREEALRRSTKSSEREQRDLGSRLEAERMAARAVHQPAQSEDWWQHADADRIGAAYQAAQAWRAEDPEAAKSAEYIREELSRRYGVDGRTPGGQSAAKETEVREQTDRAEAAMHLSEAAAAQVEEQRQREAAEFEPDPADRDAAHADADASADRASRSASAADAAYDSAERREADAAAMRGRGIDDRAVDARMRADVSQGQPPHEAVAQGRKATTKAGSRRGGQLQRERPGLGR